jgi:hypothetical protein
MSELEGRARKVLEVARGGHEPNAADALRIRAALRRRVMAEPRLLDAGLPAASKGTGIFHKLWLALGVGTAAGFAAGFYVAQAIAPSARAPEPSPRRADATVAAAGGSARALPVEAPEPASSDGASRGPGSPASSDGASRGPGSPASSDGASRGPGSPPSDGGWRGDVPPAPAPATRPRAHISAAPSVSPLKAELDGLRRAQELLHQGQAAFALARLDELDAAAVGSALLEERAATRAIAECRLDPSARQPLADFTRRFPGSAHLARVRSSCGAPTQSGAAPENLAPAPTETRGTRHE